MKWLLGCVAVALCTIGPGAAGRAEEDAKAEAKGPCAPIQPCTACHNPTLTIELAKCLAEPWVAPSDAKEIKNPIAPQDLPKAAAFGKASYDIYCDGCHGPEGDGKGQIAVKHGAPSINIAIPRTQNLTDGELFWKISNGKGAMPAWQTILPETDRWRLVVFVRTLKKTE
jgi:mono/diheme cytochrome c family protein